MDVVGQHHAPAALPPGKRHGTHFIGEWVGPRAGVDRRGKSRPGQGRPQRVLTSTGPQIGNSWGIPAHSQAEVCS